MGAIKEAMIQWMAEENLTEEDLDEMNDVNKAFFKWLKKRKRRDSSIKLNKKDKYGLYKVSDNTESD